MNPSTLFLTVGAVAGIALGACTPHPPSVGPSPDGQVTSAGDYQVVHGWPQIPAGELLGQVSGIGVDSRSNVFVFRRADRTLPATTISVEPIAEPTVWLFEGRSGRDGKVVAAFGAFGNYDGQLVWPHCLAIAPSGAVYVGDVSIGRRAQKFVP